MFAPEEQKNWYQHEGRGSQQRRARHVRPAMNKRRLSRWFVRLLMPRYDELSLFLMSLTFLILLRYRYGFLSERTITNRNASTREIQVGTAAAIVVLVLCQYVLELHWSLTYSVCLAYAANINASVQRAVRRLGKRKRMMN